jgi:hypothetical protein
LLKRKLCLKKRTYAKYEDYFSASSSISKAFKGEEDMARIP